MPSHAPACEAIDLVLNSVKMARLDVEKKIETGVQLLSAVTEWLERQGAILGQLDARMEQLCSGVDVVQVTRHLSRQFHEAQEAVMASVESYLAELQQLAKDGIAQAKTTVASAVDGAAAQLQAKLAAVQGGLREANEQVEACIAFTRQLSWIWMMEGGSGSSQMIEEVNKLTAILETASQLLEALFETNVDIHGRAEHARQEFSQLMNKAKAAFDSSITEVTASFRSAGSSFQTSSLLVAAGIEEGLLKKLTDCVRSIRGFTSAAKASIPEVCEQLRTVISQVQDTQLKFSSACVEICERAQLLNTTVENSQAPAEALRLATHSIQSLSMQLARQMRAAVASVSRSQDQGSAVKPLLDDLTEMAKGGIQAGLEKALQLSESAAKALTTELAHLGEQAAGSFGNAMTSSVGDAYSMASSHFGGLATEAMSLVKSALGLEVWRVREGALQSVLQLRSCATDEGVTRQVDDLITDCKVYEISTRPTPRACSF